MENGYTTERESLKEFEQILEDEIESAIIFAAYAGGYFWGAGASEKAAIKRAQAGNREASGETLKAVDIEVREVRGAVAFNAIEKARLRGWAALDVLDVIER